jgi:hypothetical protein
MLKHIAKHNERKAVILFHTIPGEDHMCLLVYSDVLPRIIHDTIMTCVESLPGQQATNLADALHRVIMADGRNALEVLHREGMMKKVQTSQVIMTPTANSKIRLDELNTLLAEMAKGEDAVKRLAEVDSQSGLQKKKRDNTGRDVGQPAAKASTLPAVPPLVAGDDGVLSDAAIAAQQVAQATRMKAEATSLLAEAARLEADAAKLMPPVAKVKAPAAKAKKVAAPAAMKATVNVNTKKTAKA